jgi:hypothetical protein
MVIGETRARAAITFYYPFYGIIVPYILAPCMDMQGQDPLPEENFSG